MDKIWGCSFKNEETNTNKQSDILKKRIQVQKCHHKIKFQNEIILLDMKVYERALTSKDNKRELQSTLFSTTHLVQQIYLE